MPRHGRITLGAVFRVSICHWNGRLDSSPVTKGCPKPMISPCRGYHGLRRTLNPNAYLRISTVRVGATSVRVPWLEESVQQLHVAADWKVLLASAEDWEDVATVAPSVLMIGMTMHLQSAETLSTRIQGGQCEKNTTEVCHTFNNTSSNAAILRHCNHHNNSLVFISKQVRPVSTRCG